MSVTRIVGDDCMLTLEMQDGTVISGRVLVSEVQVRQETDVIREFGDAVGKPINLGLSWEIAAQGVGEMMTSNEYVERVERKAKAPTWTCPYCGRTHPRERTECWDGVKGCGALRPRTGVADV